ncbi:DoxX family membrane protein [Chitinophaga barathri]|uniref:DoxX family membrane protein n=1 Tax=Chitinophaga barathri TaxID=1647451 RepID=A0A3N4M4U0_9BACT|nr:DoxX family membrane protein [Chitinophaga barathri]RPD37958.1 DoxX family membrane protein [Chitinophaga barathri]
MRSFFNWLDERRELGIFGLRLFIGLRLIYGTIDNVTSWDRMLEFRAFLEAQYFPFPLACAIVSVTVQLVGGFLLLLGLLTRYVSLLLIVNFLVAAWVDFPGGVGALTPPLAILFSAVLFLFYGKDRYSVKWG